MVITRKPATFVVRSDGATTVGLLPCGRARHCALPRSHSPPPPAPHTQPQAPAGPSAMAGDRQPEPDRPAPAPLHPRAFQHETKARRMTKGDTALVQPPSPPSRDGVKGFTLDLILGSTDTSMVTSEWAMSELLRNPEVLAKATEELDAVVGHDRLVTEGDIPNLPYIEAIVKETMRLHPVAPLLGPRLSREEASIDGYDIPIGTRVFVNVWAIGRDPAVWGDDASVFQPGRFVGRTVDVKGHDFELLPFGSGRRMCPGIGLGLKLVQVILANLLHGFAWSLPDGVRKEELNMEEKYGLSMPRLVPLEAVAEPRLPAVLYTGP
ncbi:hypothetical protein ACP4OV_030822 [Aristida adscensionis]